MNSYLKAGTIFAKTAAFIVLGVSTLMLPVTLYHMTGIFYFLEFEDINFFIKLLAPIFVSGLLGAAFCGRIVKGKVSSLREAGIRGVVAGVLAWLICLAIINSVSCTNNGGCVVKFAESLSQEFGITDLGDFLIPLFFGLLGALLSVGMLVPSKKTS